MSAVLEVDTHFSTPSPDAEWIKKREPLPPLPPTTFMLWISQLRTLGPLRHRRRLSPEEVIKAVERWLTENSINSWGSVPPDPYPFPLAPPPPDSKKTSIEGGGFMLVSDMNLEGDDFGLTVYVRDLAIFLARELKQLRVGFQIGSGKMQFLSATDHTELPRLKLRKLLEMHDPNSGTTRWAWLLQLLSSRSANVMLQLLSLVS